MGVEYFVVCDDCKVTRNLDKFYTMLPPAVTTREDALEYRDDIREDAFRAGLLVSFMGAHIGHVCRIVRDSDFEKLAPKLLQRGFLEQGWLTTTG